MSVGSKNANWIDDKRMKTLLICSLVGLLVSCVNDLESIQKVTYDPKAPNEATKNLHVLFNDSGYARVEVFAKFAESYTNPENVTYLKNGIKVNFFGENGEIISTLTALNGEINTNKQTMQVKDSVQLINHKKRQRLETESLHWNQGDSSIYTQSTVTVRSPQGILFGDGIRTKQDFTTYEFVRPSGKVYFNKK